MKFYEIMDQLSSRYGVRILSGTGEDNLLDLAFLDGQTRLFPETWLYFGYDDQLPEDLPRNLVLISDRPGEAEAELAGRGEEARGRSIALVPRSCAGAFFNDVRLLIEKNRRSGYYDAVTEAMDQIRDIPAFIDTASLSFGASLVLCDRDYRILAWSTAVPVTDPLWKENIVKGYCDYEFIREVRSLRTVQAMGGSRETFEVNCSRSPSRKYASMVFVGGESVGFVLLIEKEDSFREVHPRMLSSLSAALSFGIPRYAPAWARSRTGLQRLLYNLLIGARLSDFPEAVRELADPVLKGRCRVICCRPETGKAEEGESAAAWADGAEQALKDAVTVQHRNEVYILVSEECAAEAARPDSAFYAFLTSRSLKAGTGPLLESIEDFPKACLLAGRVLEEGEGTFRSFEQFLPRLMIGAFDPGMDPGLFVHPALKALKDSDAANDTHLLHTLDVYLQKGENIRDTADALFLHRNSVNYRMNRIEEIGKLDLSDPETRFALRLGLALLKKQAT